MRPSSTLLFVIGACIFGCRPSNEPAPSKPLPAADNERPVQLPKYPPGRWRLATFDALDRSVVWLAHIAIRHDKSTSGFGFRPRHWHPDDPPPARSRVDAMRLAQRIQEQASASPDKFADLAREYSEDVSTRERGGSLGGTRASQLAAAFLDALQATPLGQATAVVETPFGFHILKQLQPPPQAQLAGEHLVVYYTGALHPELRHTPERTRAQAMELARELAASEKRFSELVAAYSEHPSKARDGDMGVWSSIAPRANGRELEVLAALELGAVSDPIDTPSGIQIIKRVAVTARTRYATASIRMRFEPSEPESKATVRLRAEALAAELRADPTRFAAAQAQEGCCANEVQQWTRGSTRDEALEAAVAELEIGETTAKPIDLGRYYAIAKRLGLDAASEPAALSYELPAPMVANTEGIFRHTDRETLVKELRAFKGDFLRSTTLARAQTTTIEQLLGELEQSFVASKNGDERVAAHRRMQGALEQRLDAQALATFQQFRDTWLATKVMRNRRL